jgi:myosin protein heavy chain
VAQIEAARKEAESSSAALVDAKRKAKGDAALMDELQSSLHRAERARSSAESQLEGARQRELEVGASMEKLLAEKEATAQELESVGARHRDLEDSVLQADRKNAHLEREISALNGQLEVERQKCARADSSRRALENEALQHRQVLGEHLDHIRELKKELRTRTDELEKAKLLQDTKIVEHVHVLEEAKRYTDRQLDEMRSTLAARDQYIRNLEKTKTRLVSELEDLKHQRQQEQVSHSIGDRDRSELRSLENRVAAAKGTAERERQAKELAEAEVKKLEAELGAYQRRSPTQPAIAPGMVNRRSASLLNGAAANLPSQQPLRSLSRWG